MLRLYRPCPVGNSHDRQARYTIKPIHDRQLRLLIGSPPDLLNDERQDKIADAATVVVLITDGGRFRSDYGSVAIADASYDPVEDTCSMIGDHGCALVSTTGRAHIE